MYASGWVWRMNLVEAAKGVMVAGIYAKMQFVGAIMGSIYISASQGLGRGFLISTDTESGEFNNCGKWL